jgi:hypothetical protein
MGRGDELRGDLVRIRKSTTKQELETCDTGNFLSCRFMEGFSQFKRQDVENNVVNDTGKRLTCRLIKWASQYHKKRNKMW